MNCSVVFISLDMLFCCFYRCLGHFSLRELVCGSFAFVDCAHVLMRTMSRT